MLAQTHGRIRLAVLSGLELVDDLLKFLVVFSEVLQILLHLLINLGEVVVPFSRPGSSLEPAQVEQS